MLFGQIFFVVSGQILIKLQSNLVALIVKIESSFPPSTSSLTFDIYENERKILFSDDLKLHFRNVSKRFRRRRRRRQNDVLTLRRF